MSSFHNTPRMLPLPIRPMMIEPVTLEGRLVRLEPLALDHHAGLCEVGLEPKLWRWTPTAVRTPDEMRAFIELALKRSADGTVLPFAIVARAENRVVGTTRFLNIERTHHRVEIGSTFVSVNWQRTGVNTEAKYLLLRHAFESWGCLRVEFKTDVLNTKSRNALTGLGATQEGIFRNYAICADGRVRDSVFYSITDTEWPEVKASLEAKLAGHTGPETPGPHDAIMR